VAEFKTTFSANFSTFLWETHNELRAICFASGIGLATSLSLTAIFNPELARWLWETGMLLPYIGMAIFFSILGLLR